MVDFNYRLETTLNYLAQNLGAIGRLSDVEIVIGDWGSDVALHHVLVLGDAARAITRYVVVPPHYARPLQWESEFPIVMVQNATIRRSFGTYIMQTDSDVLFTTEFLTALFGLLESGVPELRHALFGSKRRHVPWKVFENHPPLSELDNFIHQYGTSLEMEVNPDFKYCATGMMFMNRELWDECSGYDERLTHWGWMEIDLGMRITQRYPYIDVTDTFDMILFHLEHYRSPSGERKVSRRMNPMERPNQFRPNGNQWGFPTLDFPVYRYADGQRP